MNTETFNRLHYLRMENDEVKCRQHDMRERFDRMANRQTNGTAPRAVTAYQLFQTPPEVAKRLAALLNPKAGSRILEPSAGLGRLLDAIQPYYPSEIVAVEISPQCAGELYRRDQKWLTIKQCDFLDVTRGDIGEFDAVIMNPPFHMRSDIKHIQHAMQFVKPGGRLAAICFDTEHRRVALKPMAEHWINLPPDSFKETGTHVNTAMLVINKPIET